ncbi:biotin transporter BioY [Rubrivirga sp. IMCC45206]|uniref:biotin transporter BioY n=1 Tax=Rubrivirga sp. IMCC45206 TaxID=3391614 RepID=UPI00398FD12D
MSLALTAPSAASVDRLRAADAPLVLQAALVVGTALLTALLAQFEVRIYLWEVPLTLQTVAVYGAGLFLGSRNGALAMGLYLALGLALPVYAGGASGLAHLAGASAGYLFAFPLVAAIGGAVTRRRRGFGRSLLALAGGSVALFACGVLGLWLATDLSAAEAVVNGWLRFVPWDLTKIALVGSLYAIARRATA